MRKSCLGLRITFLRFGGKIKMKQKSVKKMGTVPVKKLMIAIGIGTGVGVNVSASEYILTFTKYNAILTSE